MGRLRRLGADAGLQDFHMSNPVIMVDKESFTWKGIPFDWKSVDMT